MIRFALAVAVLLALTLAAPARAQCDPAAWSALGSGVSRAAYALTVLPEGDVIVGGDFTSVGGVAANSIARYSPTSGVWSALGSGVSGGSQPRPAVFALAVLPGGDVIVGGDFTSAGGVAANNIARYNPTTGAWSALGSGVSGGSQSQPAVLALAVLPGGDVIVGGDFTSAGGVAVNNITRYSPTTGVWSALGAGITNTDGRPTVNALAVVPGGDVIVGGNFNRAGGVVASDIARYNSSTGLWSEPGSGVFGSVYALAVLPSGDVIVGGNFTSVGGMAASRIARLNLTTGDWTTLGSGVSGISPIVFALAVLPSGDVIVGGYFDIAGGTAASRIALVNPTTRAWQPLGSGVAASSYTPLVSALAALPGGEVIAGGDFTTAGGVAANNIARYWFGATPFISGQPQSAVACPGTIFNLPVYAFDPAGGTLTYQWRKDTVPINSASARTSTLVLSNVQAGASGSYDCVITAPNTCSVTSAAADLTIATSPITTQPASQTVCAGGNVVFSVAATGSGLSYKWTRALSGSSTFSDLSNSAPFSGTGSNTLTIAAPTAGDANDTARFRCRVTTSGGCSFNSQIATFDLLAATAITAQPAPQTVCAGTPASFSVTATGTGTLTYQWRKGGVAIDTIANSTAATSTLTIASAQAADVGSYDCIVSNGVCANRTSTAAALSVNAATVVSAQPTSVGVCAGSPASFSVTATGTGTLTYQWRKDGVAISAATNPSAVTATLSFASAQTADAGTYDCIVTSPTCGSVTSDGALLAVGAPVVTLEPTNQLICPGDNVVFTGAAVGSGVTYRWARALAGQGFLNLSDGATFQGTTTPTLTIVQPLAGGPNDTARFRLRFFSACGNTDATIVTFDVLSGPPVITVPPVAQSTCPGGSATLSVTATGSGPLTYQWRKEAIAIDSIANPTAATASLILTSVQPADAVTYDCIVTNSCGSVTSNAAALTICVADSDDGSGTGTCDGGVTIDDLIYYLFSFEVGDLRTDVDDGSGTGTPDGGVTIDDLLYYLFRFELGC